MLPVIAALSGGLIIAGILATIWMATTPPPTKSAAPTKASLRTRWGRLPKTTKAILPASVVLGLIVAVWTRLLLAVVFVPIAALGIPWLLSAENAKKTIGRLEAMEEWCRQLASVLRAGQSLDQAILATVRSAPQPIAPQVRLLAERLRSRVNTDQALRMFGDDLNDPTGDTIVYALRLGASRSGGGLATILSALAESVAEDVADRRAIEAAREGPRNEARIVTVMILVMVTLLFVSGYLSPLTSPLGQIILLSVLAAMAGLMVWLRKMSAPFRPPRLAASPDAAHVSGYKKDKTS